jgi:surfactin synthase thioesterase subunit/acyl carrier protein
LNVALAALWNSFGLTPSAMLAQGIGALAAAYCAGVMELDAAARMAVAAVDPSVDAGNPRLSVARYPFVSAAGGDAVPRDSLADEAFWLEEAKTGGSNVEDGLLKLTNLGCAVTVDLSAGALLEDRDVEAADRSDSLWLPVFMSLARLFCLGADLDWNGVYKPFGKEKLQLPTYPFQRRHFWIDALPFGAKQVQVAAQETQPEPSSNPYDAILVPSPLAAKHYEFRLEKERVPDITDSMGALHVGYYQQLLASAVQTAYGHLEYTVKDFSFLATLPVADVIRKSVHVILTPNDDDSVKFEFYTQDFSKAFWTLHAHGQLVLEREGDLKDMDPRRLEEIKNRCTREMGAEEFYEMLENRLLKLGRGLRWIDQVWYREGEALARFRLPDPAEKMADYGLLHPGIWDSCSQLFFVSFSDKIDRSTKYMMVNWKDFVFDCEGKDDEIWCYINLSGNPDERGFVVGTFELFDKDGRFVARTSETSLQEVPQQAYDAFKEQAERDRSQQQAGKNEALLATLRGLPIQKGALELSTHLKERMARLLGMNGDELDIKEPLRNVGMDSLVGLDFKKEIESELGIEIPIETLIQGPSIFQLSESLMQSLPGRREERQAKTGSSHKKRGYSMDIQSWLPDFTGRENAKFRLFCLPYGGRGASAYKNWQSLLPEEVEVCAIQLPGREDRLNEPPIKTMDEMVETLDQVLDGKMDIPFGFYGHSFGSFISYNLTCRWMREKRSLPKHLFLGGCSAPQIIPNPLLMKIAAAFKDVGIEELPDPEVADTFTVEQLRVFLNSPELKVITKQDEEIARALIPTVLSDINIVKSNKFVPQEGFAVPITCFHGLTDEDVAEDEMRAWEEVTAGRYTIHLLPGDHFFLNENKDQKDLVALIGKELKPYIK